jgi:hypothetical protein
VNKLQIRTALDQFFFAPVSGSILAFFRVAVALFCMAKFLSFRGDILNMFGSYGFVRTEITEILLSDFKPRLSWFTDAGATIGMGEVAAIYTLYVLFLLVLVALALGIQSRLMAILALFLHLTFFNSGRMFMYGVDYFTTSALFYCALFPVGNFGTLRQIRKRGFDTTLTMPVIYLRILQGHLCLVYFFGGIGKALGNHWWNGEAIWRAVSIPGFYQIDMSWLASVPWLSLVLGVGVLLLECGYPLFMNIRKTRPLFLVLIITMHAGIGIVMGLWYFAILMILLNGVGYGYPWIIQWLTRFTSRKASLLTVSSAPEKSKVASSPQ